MEVEIILDEAQFGAIASDKMLPICNFYKQRDNELEFITQRNADPNKPVLVAVTKRQYSSWKNSKWECRLND